MQHRTSHRATRTFAVNKRPPISRDITELDKARQESVAMKAKIRSLELEGDTLRQRLDSLRKAKNTTVIKRECEERIIIQPPPISRGIPHQSDTTTRQHRSQSLVANGHADTYMYGTRPGSGHAVANWHQSNSSSNNTISTPQSSDHWKTLEKELAEKQKLLKEKDIEIERIKSVQASLEQSFQDRFSKITSDHQKKVGELEERLKEKDNELENERKQSLDTMTLQASKEDFEEELEKLRKEKMILENRVDELVSANVKLKESNLVLQGKCETLLEDLSVKEAQWTEKEDRLHAEIRKQWGDRYHLWIAKAEKKMEELQQINVMLQSMMKTKAQNPGL